MKYTQDMLKQGEVPVPIYGLGTPSSVPIKPSHFPTVAKFMPLPQLPPHLCRISQPPIGYYGPSASPSPGYYSSSPPLGYSASPPESQGFYSSSPPLIYSMPQPPPGPPFPMPLGHHSPMFDSGFAPDSPPPTALVDGNGMVIQMEAPAPVHQHTVTTSGVENKWQSKLNFVPTVLNDVKYEDTKMIGQSVLPSFSYPLQGECLTCLSMNQQQTWTPIPMPVMNMFPTGNVDVSLGMRMMKVETQSTEVDISTNASAPTTTTSDEAVVTSTTSEKSCRPKKSKFLFKKEKHASSSSSSSSRKASFCLFCKSNRETKLWYESHVLRDETSGICICPILRKYTCPMCGATGDNAHTKQYCPENPNNVLGVRSCWKKALAAARSKLRNSNGVVGAYRYW